MHSRMRDLSDRSGVAFGTSGVRGLVSAMTDALCYAWAQAFLKSPAGRDARAVVVGCDLRPSSPRIAAACMQAIRDAGLTAVYVGEVPTPALAYYAAVQGLPAIMVTGSHIPFDRNGIKFYRADGEIGKADEQAILDAEVSVPAVLVPEPVPAASPEAREAFIRRYVDFFGAGALSGRRIAVYEHSSVARDVLRDILEALGAQVLSLGRTGSFVPIDTEAVRAEDIEQAHAWAKAHAFDALLSTDGDADRPLMGDETGQWMRGDVVGILCAQALAADVVVTPVSSNTAVERCASFRRVVRTRIGSPYVIAGMDEARVSDPQARVVGYEANGGFLLGSDIQRAGLPERDTPATSGDGSPASHSRGESASHADRESVRVQNLRSAPDQHCNGPASCLRALPTRDSVLPMLALLTLAARRGVPLSALASGLPARFTASDRIQNVPTEFSRALITRLAAAPAEAALLMAPQSGAVTGVDTTDGLRVTFESGDIVHLRPSGNAPELRCYAEAASGTGAERLCMACLEAVRAIRQAQT